MSLNVSIENAEDELKDIIKAPEDKQDDITIFDSYETLNIAILKLIKDKDNKWVEKIFTVIKKNLLEILKEKKELKLRDIRNYLEDTFIDTEKRQLIDYIVDLICIDCDTFYLKKNKKINKENDEENQEDNNKDPVINIPLEDIIKFDEFRNNQIKAIDETILENYISGVHDQIMGAGKTFVILKLIWEHYKKYKDNQIYPIICYRQ